MGGKVTTSILQGEILVLMDELRKLEDGAMVSADARIGQCIVPITLTKRNGECLVHIACPDKKPIHLSCPLDFEDATEENNETWDIACAWMFSVNREE